MDMFDHDSPMAARLADPTRCRQCGASVSPQFARVFGDNENVIHSCLKCTSARELWSGDAARRE